MGRMPGKLQHQALRRKLFPGARVSRPHRLENEGGRPAIPGSRRIAQLLTVLLMGAVLGAVLWRKRPAEASAPENTPETAIWRMVDASRAGDVERYLACYTGEMARLLRQNLLEMGEPRFREYLLATHRAVKGVAVSPPQMTSATEGRIPVEYVYQDRNEVQQVYLRNDPGGWKIFRVESAERVPTLIPYGTPVTE